MIKLLPLVLLFSLAYGQNSDYLLPDYNTLLVHKLADAFKHSHERILIITPAFHHAILKRAALEGVRRGSRFTLIVQSLKNDPIELAQYERVVIRTLGGRPLKGSVVFVDDRLVCTVPDQINDESFSADASLVRCSDDAPAAAGLYSALLPLLNRSKPYLE